MPKILSSWKSKLTARKELRSEVMYEQEKVLEVINVFWTE